MFMAWLFKLIMPAPKGQIYSKSPYFQIPLSIYKPRPWNVGEKMVIKTIKKVIKIKRKIKR